MLCVDYIYGAPFHIYTTSGNVIRLEGKPVTLFRRKHFSVPHTFHLFNPFIKRKYLYQDLSSICIIVFSCHTVEHLGPKIFVHAVLTLDKEIKRNQFVKDPGCIGGRSSSKIALFLCLNL